MPPPAPPPPPEQNNAQNQVDKGGGILNGGDNLSTPRHLPPPENPENRAQKLKSGGSGESGGIFLNPSVEDKSVSGYDDTPTLEQELILKRSKNACKNYRQQFEVTSTM
jgi:hypothetical protein